MGATLADLYRKGMWALCPSRSIVVKYFRQRRGGACSTLPLVRSMLPSIDVRLHCTLFLSEVLKLIEISQEPLYEYTLLPLSEKIAGHVIHSRGRHKCGASREDATTTHVYPFDDLPTIQSHVHPSFVLLHLTRQLSERVTREDYIVDLVDKHDLAHKIHRLWNSWTKELTPEWVVCDPSFGFRSSDAMYDLSPDTVEKLHRRDAENGGSDTESVHTVPRRVWCTPFNPVEWEVWPTVRSLKRSSPTLTESSALCDCQFRSGGSSDSGRSSQAGHAFDSDDLLPSGWKDTAKRFPCRCPKRKKYSTSELEAECASNSERVPEDEGWTASAIANWARNCSNHPLPYCNEPEIDADNIHAFMLELVTSCCVRVCNPLIIVLFLFAYDLI